MTRNDTNLLMAGVPLTALFILLAVMTLSAVIGQTCTIERPEILVLREETVKGYDGHPVLLIDYMVGGIATNASFQAHQMNEYWAVMEHLKSTGRVKYALPRFVP